MLSQILKKVLLGVSIIGILFLLSLLATHLGILAELMGTAAFLFASWIIGFVASILYDLYKSSKGELWNKH